MVSWIRQKSFFAIGVSVIWNGFLLSLTWASRCISWQVGNGVNTLIGLDLIVGMDTLTFFPMDVREYLEDYGITSLAHARNISLEAQGYWLAAEDLELGGEWKFLWDKYISSLEHDRIRLNHTLDTLIWTHNRQNGEITVALVYDLISNYYLEPTSYQNNFLELLWSFNIPLKIRCFIWLIVGNRILTWENLMKRGWLGPSLCALCRNGEDSSHCLWRLLSHY